MEKQEAILLRKINKDIPPQKRRRLFALQTKRKLAALSLKEETELAKLIDYAEELEVKRMQNMLTLAKIWKMNLEELREKLSILMPPVHVW